MPYSYAIRKKLRERLNMVGLTDDLPNNFDVILLNKLVIRNYW